MLRTQGLKRVFPAVLFLTGLMLLAGFPVRAEEAPSEKAVGAVFPEKKWFENVHMAGFVDAYYSYNFNNPDSMKNGVGTNFDFDHNSFSLSMAELVFHKDPDPVGFRVDLDFGPTTDFVHCGAVNCGGTNDAAAPPTFTPAPESSYKNIQQAYVSWATPLGPKLEFGKFVTHMGAEVIESKDNWNYTRGLLFCCAIPYYHAGVRANVPVNDMLFVNGYVYNGWNNVVETNDMKTFGATIGITPIPQLPILLNWVGPEAVAGAYEDKQVYDAIVTFNATDNLSFMVNYDYGSQKDLASDETFKYSGWAAYARWKMGTHAFAVRYEMVDDEDDLMFGGVTADGNKINELTLTAEKMIGGSLLTRLEYRMDSSDDKIYEDDKGGLTAEDSQSRVVLGVVYQF